jgi:DNA-binding NarL/FixJ family response regulator
MSEPTRVLIVDDHPLVREGLAARIGSQPHLEVCGEAADVDEALELLGKTRPGLMIVDLALRTGHGLDLIRKTAALHPNTKMLVISAHDEALFAERALSAGAAGYINKQEAQHSVIDGISAVLRGERFVGGAALKGESAPSSVGNLSDRELQIFELIGRGNSTRTIAEQLHLSVHTVETHRENIRAKLHLRKGSDLVRYAVQWVLESGNAS